MGDEKDISGERNRINSDKKGGRMESRFRSCGVPIWASPEKQTA
jgi:hypothetical protein